MVCSHAFAAMHLNVNLLPRTQLGDEDVRIKRSHRSILFGEPFSLFSNRTENEVFCIDVRIMVKLERVIFVFCSFLIFGAFGLKLEHQCVSTVDIRIVRLIIKGTPPVHVPEPFGIPCKGYEPKPLRQYLVLNYGGVVLDVDRLNGEGRHFGEQDATEGVGDGGINANEREQSIIFVILVNLDMK